jgi:glutamate synthase domain-containing protein 3
MENHQAFIKEMQTRFDKKVRENEISLLEYWKSHLDKLLTMKPEGIASLQLQIKKITDMMENRLVC